MFHHSKFIRWIFAVVKWNTMKLILQFRFLNILVILAFIFTLFLYIKLEFHLDKLNQERKALEHLIIQIKKYASDEDINLEDDNLNNRNERKKKGLLNDLIVIYNRVPKTGSTSFMGIAYDICAKNNFNVLHLNVSKNSHVMSLYDQATFVYNITQWNQRKPSLYHGHVSFIDFRKFGVNQQPIYINIIRKPLDRLVSYYYFLRFGDDFRPHVVRRRQGDKMTFDECIEKQERDCNPDNMWMQIPFFCGQEAECWNPGSEWALEQAKQNLANHYLLVGVTEEIHDFVAILETILPQFFKGALHLYEQGTKSHLRKTHNKLEPSPETQAIIHKSKIWKMENQFYEFALQQFNFIRQKILMFSNGQLKDHNQHFFYEKIRPK